MSEPVEQLLNRLFRIDSEQNAKKKIKKYLDSLNITSVEQLLEREDLQQSIERGFGEDELEDFIYAIKRIVDEVDSMKFISRPKVQAIIERMQLSEIGKRLVDGIKDVKKKTGSPCRILLELLQNAIDCAQEVQIDSETVKRVKVKIEVKRQENFIELIFSHNGQPFNLDDLTMKIEYI